MGDPSTTGAVLVVGGGVAGMQASLDLADSGYKVYLAEKESSIGGTMAQLDKTFPSNDCSMCILAPRLVSVGRHLNIEVLPNTELVRVDGEAGRFQVSLKRRGTFVDPSRCTGCGECTQVCPVELPNEFNLGLGTRKAISKRYPQAVPAQFAISKRERPPCQTACSAGTNVQAYVALTAQGKFTEALAVVRERMPFASVCGRICLHRCEQECNRTSIDHPVAIMHIKRFLADWDFQQQNPLPPPTEKTRGERIAVVGGGPAGLTCAHDLAKMGYRVTLFEASPQLGGLLRSCIPKFRLPEGYLERDIAYLLSPGFEVRKQTALGRDFTLDDLEARGYRAVFLATGAHQPTRLPIPGHDLQGITLNLDFLRKARAGEPVDLAGRLLVVGGGNVAMDVARTARRLGIQHVTMACLESREKMPAHAWEVQEALDEGIEIINDVTFKRFLGRNGHVVGAEVKRISSMAFDADGRLTVSEIPGSEFTLPAERVVIAIGQRPELSYLESKNLVSVSRRGLVEVAPETLLTAQPGVAAGGDVVTGTAFVVDAVAAGHRAAATIDRCLRGEPLPPPAPKPEPPRLTRELAELKLRRGEVLRQNRVAMPQQPKESRVTSFEEVDLGYSQEMAMTEARRCLSCGLCSECMQCVAACQAHAINHLLPREESFNLQVGAVILAPGTEVFNPESKPEYGYKRYPNVVTSLEFERILSPSGPYAGKVRRPSDRAAPKKIAFVQCVGSREVDRNYCSSVCCMYTAKQAVIAKEHEPGVECTVFYIDLRAVSKGFEAYIERAKAEGVRYIRCRPSAIREVHGTRDLIVEYADGQGRPQHEVFHLVVLAVGLTPSASSRQLAQVVAAETDAYGFCHALSFTPTHTSRPGVFVCGPYADPMDIPETVAGASACAAHAMSLLADSRGTLVRKKEYPPERDVSGAAPRVGVFVCHCGTNIAGVVDVEQVVQYARTLPGVVYAERNLYTCSDDTQRRIRETIAELDLNRIVVASCTPRTHEALFQDTIREAGLNRYYFELANIRDQCSWVHMREHEKATEKAKDLVRIAVAKVRLDTPLHKRPLEVTPAALVIGGGPAGLVAALELADQGFKVYLVEKEKELGGHLRGRRYLLWGEDPRQRLWELMARARTHPHIELLLDTTVTAVSGSLGNFTSTLAQPGQQREVRHGVIIVATGAEVHRPTECRFGQDPRVILNNDLEEFLSNGKFPGEAQQELLANGRFHADSVVFIQCVGSRAPERPYCSRTCCMETVKNALHIKRQNPATQVTVLYRDIRTYGLREAFYRQARELGARFVRYPDERLPEVVERNGRLCVMTQDQLTHTPAEFEADIVVLSAATVPNPGNKELAQLLKVPLSEDGFFLEAHRKLRPVDFATDGIFLCGAAHSPMGLREALAQAGAAAARAATILSRQVIDLEPTISHVVTENCDGCAYCVDPCPYKAITLTEYKSNGETKKRVEVNEAICKGCGTCQATCPKNAIFVWHFRPEQLLAEVHAALRVE